MADPTNADTSASADATTDAGVADEVAAYNEAVRRGDKPAPKSIDEGDPKSTSDGSGTSETD